MPRREPFETGEYYHVFNRGVEKRNIFLDNKDKARFMESIEEFNKQKRVKIRDAREQNTPPRGVDTPLGGVFLEPLVEVFCHTLRDNHFHLILFQLKDNGISSFMSKVLSGYTRYFNIKYKRVGHLFQGAFNSESLKFEGDLLQCERYIHLNCLDEKFIEWRVGLLQDWKAALKELEEFEFSSCRKKLKEDPNYGEYLREWAQRKLPTPRRGG